MHKPRHHEPPLQGVDENGVVSSRSPAEHTLSNCLRPTRFGGRVRELSLVALLLAVGGCGRIHTLAPLEAAITPPTGLASISWFSPLAAGDALQMQSWRAAVGSPIVLPDPTPESAPADELTIVTWNIALDSGDVVELVREVRARNASAPIVLLLQEAFRGGDDVPRAPQQASFAAHLGRCDDGREVDRIARELGFSLYYVPSMRNGMTSAREDRGNAVLSSVPLDELSAIELPFERQRRVAVGARIAGRTSQGRDWSLRLVNVHLDNLVGARYGWLGTEFGRARQARGLREALAGDEPTILAGDFNTWFGFSDRVYLETARAFPQTRVTDARRTFRGLLRLDHVFYRLAPGWTASTVRAESSFGSDHHPLITTVRF
jgi:endonuclease/exonuclease/phosphatase family metal-dependent hydrolase